MDKIRWEECRGETTSRVFHIKQREKEEINSPKSMNGF